MSVFFNGRLITTPTVDVKVDDSAMWNLAEQRYANTVAIIGTARGGEPATALEFIRPLDARRTLIGGDLLRAVEKAFAPSEELNSPAKVIALRVNAAEQSTLAVPDEAAGTAMTLTSTEYGTVANQVRATITKSLSNTTRTVTIANGTASISKAGIGLAPMSIQYTGAQASATVAVNTTKITLKAPSSSVTPSEFTFTDYASVQELADAINAVAGWEVTALTPARPAANLFDVLTATACKASAVTLRADLRAIVDWINTYAYTLATAAMGTTHVPPDDLTTTYFTGGTDGTAPTNDDWQACFDRLQESDVQWVVPLSADADIWAMAKAHAQLMSTTGQSERRVFVGSDTSETLIANVVDLAQSMDDDRVALVFPNILDYDESGALVLYPAYFLAAQIAGGFASMTPGSTMTNKTLRLYGLYPSINTIVDSDDLIDGGVCAVRKSKKGYVVSKAISTWQQDSKYNRVEISCGRAVDFTVATVRDALDRFVGAKGAPITLYEAAAATETALRELAKPEPAGLAVLVGDDASPAYRNITVEITGDVMQVSFECSPVIPVNYVLVTVYAKPWAGSLTVA